MSVGDANPGDQIGPVGRAAKREWMKTLARSVRYLAIRVLVVFLTILVGVYAAIWVTNLGGYADSALKEELRMIVLEMLNKSKTYHTLTSDEKNELIGQMEEEIYRANDLDQPFAKRSFRYFRDAFTLTLGEARMMTDRSGSAVVLDVLMDKLPMTLLLFGTANLLTFFGGLFIALALSRRFGGPLDRAVTMAIPALSAPPWFHGLFLIVIFASLLRLLPFGGVMSPPLPETTFGYVLGMLKHMILPVSAIVLGTLPAAVYANRALFMIHASEDYVELAKAKGVRAGRLQRRYILRPVLPPIITNFAFIAIVAWQGIVITERVFNWPGLGSLLIRAIELRDVSVIMGVVTMLAYLLGLSVLLLDVLYVVVDPRVSLGAGGRS